ncbi:MAG: tail fiber domain-containing protein [Reichenbachiella sp.]|uniref:tail fiber domain-containing protein n=1 Tax=Reichenbachiella sp. TaxID=2184521 RepID=UPI003299ECA4
MKLNYNSCIALLGVAILSISNLFAQNQRIPFQGTLYQSGTAVNGTVNITFTIDDPAWTETHENVNVTQGVYAVVLGASTAFPTDMFTNGATPQMTVSIGGTEVADVPLYAPFISKEIVGENIPDQINKTFDEDGPEFNGLTVVVDGSGDAQTAALEGVAQSTTQNTGVEGFAVSGAGNTDFQYGVYGQSAGDGTGNHRGLMGYGAGAGKYNHGVKGYATGNGNGDTGTNYGEGSINFGVEGNANGNTWNNTGVEGSNSGTAGVWNFGVHGISNAGTGDAVENHGIAGRAYGPGVNYGVYGQANDGVENYAGFFEGDVNINGELLVNGSPINLASDSLFEVRNPDGDVRAELSYFDTNDAGSVLLYGTNDSTKVILGTSSGGYAGGLWLYDSLRNLGAQLRVTNKGRGNLYTYNENHQNVGWFGGYNNDGFAQIVTYDDAEEVTGAALIGAFADGSNPEFYLEGVKQEYLGLARMRVEQVGAEEAGKLEINTSNNGAAFSVGVINDAGGNDTDGYSTEMFLRGTNTPNIQMGGQAWENNDLANFQMYGRTDSGDGWYHSNINMSIGSNGTDDWGGLSITRSNLAGNTNTETFNVNGQNGDGTFAGSVSMGNNRVNLGTKSWEGNGGSERGVIFLDGTDDSGIIDRGRASLEVNNDGSGSYGYLLLRNYVDAGGGSPTHTVELNGENGDASFNGNVVAGSFESNGDYKTNNDNGANVGWFGRNGNDGYARLLSFDDSENYTGAAIVGSFIDGSNPEFYLEGSKQAFFGLSRLRVEQVGTEEAGRLELNTSNSGSSVVASNVDLGGGNYSGSLELSTNQSNDSKMSITSGGINMGQNAYTDGIVMNYDNSGGGILEMYSGSAAQVVLNGTNGTGDFTGAVTHTSDARFKKNVKSIDGALAKTQQLNGYTYNWNKLAKKQKGIDNKEEQVGVLAQELEAVFPQLVKTDDEGYKSVNYAALTAVLIEAVKELSEQVGTLQGENAELKAELTKVDELEIKIDLIQKLLAKQTMEASKATVSR